MVRLVCFYARVWAHRIPNIGGPVSHDRNTRRQSARGPQNRFSSTNQLVSLLLFGENCAEAWLVGIAVSDKIVIRPAARETLLCMWLVAGRWSEHGLSDKPSVGEYHLNS